MLKLPRSQKVTLVSSGIFLMRLIGYLPPIVLMAVIGYFSSILLFVLLGYLFPTLPITKQTSPVPSPNASSQPFPETTKKKAAQPSPSPQLSSPISKNGAGLGDTKANFDGIHGFNLADDQSGIYKNNYINVAYDNGVAYYISLLFENTQTTKHNKNDALSLVMSFMPHDSVKIKELPARENVYLIYFESQKLGNAMPVEWHKRFWDGVKPGSFLVIFNHEEGNPDSVFAVTLAAGNNVPFLSKK